MGRKEISNATPTTSRLGFMNGEASVPDDFDQMDAEEIIALFEADNLFPPDEQRDDE
jgi:hypothetical protein